MLSQPDALTFSVGLTGCDFLLPQPLHTPVVTFTIVLKNNGTVTDTYTVLVEDSNYLFRSRLFANKYINSRRIKLAPQNQISVTIWVDIPLTSTVNMSNTTSILAFNGYDVRDEVESIIFISTFQEVGGQVVMDAEHFAARIDRSGRSWVTQTVLADYAGTSYLSALPDTDHLYDDANDRTSPSLSYNINFTTPGTYTIWLRGYASNSAGDSAYISLDSQPAAVLTGFIPRQWHWVNQSNTNEAITFEITEPGQHTLNIWQREDGIRLDKIILTTDDTYVPNGVGPDESSRTGAN